MALSSSTALPTSDDAVTNPTSGLSSPSPLEISPLVTLPIIVVLLGLVIFLLLRRRPKNEVKA